MDQQLLEILACPDTHHAPLRHEPAAQTLTCTECGRIFPIRDGIPVLLLDEAEDPVDRAAGAAEAPVDQAEGETGASPSAGER